MRTLALICLLAMQDPDVDTLLMQLSDPTVELRTKAFETLEALGEKVEARVRDFKVNATGEAWIRCDTILRRIQGKRRFASVIPPLRRVSLSATNEPLIKVLDHFESQTGWRPIEGVGELADKPVSVQIKEATPLEALDAVCKSVGVDFEFDPGWRPSFDRGQVYPDFPVCRIRGVGFLRPPQAFVRHYRVLASHLTLTRAQRFAEVGRGCQVGISVQWSPEFSPEEITFQPISVVDDKGRNLYDPKPYAKLVYRAERRQRDLAGDDSLARSIQRGWDLRFPEPNATSISSLKGRIRVNLRTDQKYIEFKNPADEVGKVLTYEGVAIRLKEFRNERRRQVVVLETYWTERNTRQYWRPATDRLVEFHDIELRTGPDERLMNRCEVFEQSGGTIDGKTVLVNSFRLEYPDCEGKGMTVRVLMDWTRVDDTFDFELKDIPLPK